MQAGDGRWTRQVLAAAVLVGAGPGLLSGASGRPAPPATYEIYGVRFARLHGFPVSDLVLGADTARRADLAFIVWVLRPTDPTGGNTARGEKRLVLFDAGFYRTKFLTQWKPVDFVRPSTALARIGIRPDEVTDVIISHIHWDHVDGADLFPRARIWLQRAEYEHYVGPDGMARARGIDTVDAAMLARLRREGRIRLIDGDSQPVVPGVVAYTGGRHTYASPYITVRTADGQVVLASDNVYMYENLTRHLPIAATYAPADSASNRAAQDRMRRLASDPRLILPGHDPLIFERFATPGDGVALIR